MRHIVIAFMVLFTPLCLAEADVSAKNCSAESAAKLISLQGKLFFDAGNSGQWQSAQLNQSLCEGSRVRLEAYSRASLLLPNGITLRLGEGTVLSLNGIAPTQPALLDLVKGFLHFISRTPKQLKITTPIANAGPEGTEFALRADDSTAAVWVYEGAVRFFNESGDIKLNPGEAAQAALGQAPRSQIDIKPADAVNWALYYPSLLAYPDANTAIDPALRSAIEEYRHGRVDTALATLDSMPTSQQTPYFLKVRAAIRLTAGNSEAALHDIRALLSNNPLDADALALESVLNLTQNRKSEALDLAKRAVAANAQSPTAYSALSYTQQAHFDLEQALASARKARELAPHDAMTWARQAELELALGLQSDSQQSAKQAFALDPNLERTQTVQGFSQLFQMDTDQALRSFETGVNLDSTSPLARLGLGLAKIRRGDIEAGRQDLEIAAILDPSNSLIRSYLGKAYYEEKRNDLAKDQFDLAKQRDPNDPTPYFYDAINKQTTNRPVEALHDMQKAIELNDNRGVYRSSLMLDKDLAARSAAQGRIYNDLGFQQQGLLEGWKSVNKDEDNYSAHRLLADNYAAMPRHEIARVSELLQSQLLQPVNITPLQPNLADSNLFITNGLGPNELSYNEYNPLFEYNRFALQASGIYGGNNTKGDNVALSGLQDNVSFSLGQFHYETDGFRENNYLRKDLYNAFLQAQVTDRLNLQAEYRHERSNNGDLSLNFDPNNYSNNFKENRNIDSYRLGGRYEFSPHSSLIGSLIYQQVREEQNSIETIIFPADEFFPEFKDQIPFEIKTSRNGYISELQHRYNHSEYSLITGFGHIDQKLIVNTNDSAPYKSEPNRTNIYNYSTFNISNKLAATLGISVDFFSNDTQRLTPLNPKFGVVWNPFNSTTFRAALFRNLYVTRTSNQTIEPTQVAGFNQFFIDGDDSDGTVAWRYGAGVDHRFSKTIASGLEYSERKLYKPGFSDGLDRAEQIARAYVYVTPHARVSLGTEYFYERIDQTGRGTTISSSNALTGGLFEVVETHRFPVTLGLFHPSGLAFKIKNSFVHQSGIFQNLNTQSSDYDVSNFFVLDLSLSYRLPRRHGMLSLGINNVFDDPIHYQNTNSNETLLAPGRVMYSRINLAF